MVEGVFGLVRSAITFGTLIALLVNLSPWVAVLALLSPIPAFISGNTLWVVGLPPDAAAVAGPATDGLPVDTADDRHVQQGGQALHAGRPLHRPFRETADSYYEDTKQLLVRRYVSGFAWGALTIVTAVGTFLYVARLALRGTISIGSVAVYAQTVQQLQGAFQGCSAASRASTSTGCT
jgi:ATP-binding cassette subfamily B protein